jgi:hypothetical protein
MCEILEDYIKAKSQANALIIMELQVCLFFLKSNNQFCYDAHVSVLCFFLVSHLLLTEVSGPSDWSAKSTSQRTRRNVGQCYLEKAWTQHLCKSTDVINILSPQNTKSSLCLLFQCHNLTWCSCLHSGVGSSWESIFSFIGQIQTTPRTRCSRKQVWRLCSLMCSLCLLLLIPVYFCFLWWSLYFSENFGAFGM